MAISFEPVLNIGHIATIITLIAGGTLTYTAIISAQETQAERIRSLEEQVKSFAPIPLTSASNSIRISNVEAVIATISETNVKLLEKIGQIQVDIATIKTQQGDSRRIGPP